VVVLTVVVVVKDSGVVKDVVVVRVAEVEVLAVLIVAK